MDISPTLRGKFLAGVALAAVVFVAAGVSALEVPYLSGRVNDYAGMIDDASEARITEKLESFETQTGSQVAVLTIDTLAGDALEEFSHRVAETWALGREGADDGVLLLVVKNDRKMRIEVGYGLEGDLTDAESGRILRHVLRPRFQEGDFSGGIEDGVDTILATLEGAEVPPPSASTSDFEQMALPSRLFMLLVFLGVIGTFSLSALFSSGCSGWFLYFFLMPFWAAFPGAILHPKAGIVCLIAWIVLFPLFKIWLGRTAAGKRWMESRPGFGGWTSGGGGFSGGGFSGGFSGGGGSFGGGGASGSW